MSSGQNGLAVGGLKNRNYLKIFFRYLKSKEFSWERVFNLIRRGTLLTQAEVDANLVLINQRLTEDGHLNHHSETIVKKKRIL